MKRLIISFLVSNIFNFTASAIFGGILTAIFIVPHLGQIGNSSSAVVAYIHANKLALWSISGVGGLVSIASGYLGALIARRRYLLMGALSATGCCIEILFSFARSGMTLGEILYQVFFSF